MQPTDRTDASIVAHLPFPPSSVTLVPFLFGAADLDALLGTALSRLLTDLDMTEAAARTLIARMRRRGFLRSERVGRRTTYHLAGGILRYFDQAMLGPGPTRWEGHFYAVVFRVPERGRGFRDQLRVSLQRLGFGVLRPGLLISPREQWAQVEAHVVDAPDLAQVLPARLAMDLPAAREAAEIAWGLTDRCAEYALVAERLRAFAAERPLPEPSGAALRRYYQLQQTALHLSLSDAGLPRELLPEGWPAAEALTARYEFYRSWQPIIGQYVRRILQETGTTDLAVWAGRDLSPPRQRSQESSP